MGICLRFKFWLLRKFNKDEPSWQECLWALTVKKKHHLKIGEALKFKTQGYDMPEIAENMNCTRERVRQLIRAGVRNAKQEIKR